MLPMTLFPTTPTSISGRRSQIHRAHCVDIKKTLLHVLNNCNIALHHWRYNQRHDEVLKEIASFITVNLKVSQNMIVDLSSQKYSKPSHLPCTDLRPDIIWWDEHSKRIVVVELTICFNTLFKQAAERKRRKYFDLCENNHHNVSLITHHP